ncbi:hypothetical protein A2U01_0100232, partial [Trifolium medium]|nr:hypothetical protein [Trifolium medium]
YRIHARVSRFDRFATAEGKSHLRTAKGESKSAEAEEIPIPMSQKKECDDAAEGVRVGDVLVRLGGQKEKE